MTQWEFDPFGRDKKQIYPDGKETVIEYFKTDSAAPANATYLVKSTTTAKPPVIKYFDELKREVRSENIGFNGQKIFVDQIYDEQGLLTHVSEPYFDGSNPLWMVNEYDDLDRIVISTAPGNRQTHTQYDSHSV
ncbi:MAG: hypothetical protein SGJ02_01250 [bacterium]|nr:hypothetical protein [bacterium]